MLKIVLLIKGIWHLNNKLTKLIYFSHNLLFYDYNKLSGSIKKKVLIIFNFDKNLCVISIDPSLRKDAPDVFKGIDLNTDAY